MSSTCSSTNVVSIRELADKLAEALRLLDNVTAAQDSEADYLGQAENLLRQALAEYDAAKGKLTPVDDHLA